MLQVQRFGHVALYSINFNYCTANVLDLSISNVWQNTLLEAFASLSNQMAVHTCMCSLASISACSSCFRIDEDQGGSKLIFFLQKVKPNESAIGADQRYSSECGIERPNSEFEIGCASGWLQKSHFKKINELFALETSRPALVFVPFVLQPRLHSLQGVFRLLHPHGLEGSRPWADPWPGSEIRLKVVVSKIESTKKSIDSQGFCQHVTCMNMYHVACSQCCTHLLTRGDTSKLREMREP